MISYASLICLNFSFAPGLSWFLSGWYWSASFLYAWRTSFALAPGGRPKVWYSVSMESLARPAHGGELGFDFGPAENPSNPVLGGLLLNMGWKVARCPNRLPEGS